MTQKERDLSAKKAHLLADKGVELADVLFYVRESLEHAQALERMLKKGGAPVKALHLSAMETLLAHALTEATGLSGFLNHEAGRSASSSRGSE